MDAPTGLFELPEYRRAAERHAFSAVEALTEAKSPLLAQIRSEPTEAIPVSRVTDRDGGVLEHMPIAVPMSFAMDISPVVAGDLGGVYAALDAAATQQEAVLSKALFSYLSEITEMTGNQLDAGGRPMSWDLLTDALERLETRFDKDGMMDLTIVIHPDDLERFEKLGPPTAEQQARHDGVLERKRREWQERQRPRRLR